MYSGGRVSGSMVSRGGEGIRGVGYLGSEGTRGRVSGARVSILHVCIHKNVLTML